MFPGLRNKREVWRVRYALSQIRSVARNLMTLEEKDPKRLFDGAALLRRLTRLGLLSGQESRLPFLCVLFLFFQSLNKSWITCSV